MGLSALGAGDAVQLSAVVFLAYGAGWLYRSRPRSQLKNLIAVYFLAVLVRELAGVIGVVEGFPGIDGRASFGHSIWVGSFFWVSLATVAIYYVYPREPELLSGHTFFLAALAILFAVGGVLWFVASEVYSVSGELHPMGPGAHNLLWWIAVRGPGMTFLIFLALCSAVMRAEALGAEERRTALILLPALVPWIFMLSGTAASHGVFELAGFREAISNKIAYLASRPGDIGNLLPILFGTRNVLALGLVGYLIWRHRSYTAALITATGFMMTAIPNLRFPGTFPFYYIWAPLAVLYVIGRRRAFGGDDRDRTGWDLTAGTVTVIVFGMLVTVAMAHRPEEATLAAAIAVAAPLAMVAGVSVHPEGWFLQGTFLPVGRGSLGIGPSERSGRGELGDRFDILEHMGSGGSGGVYRARDHVLDREVAVKALHAAASGQDAWERLLKEARLLSGIDHPGILQVHDLVRIDGDPHLVMEYAPGGSLADTLEAGPLPMERFRKVGLDLSGALGEIHRKELLHRDIKPANILLGKDGEAQLADFGIARGVDEQTALAGHAAGTPRGTVAYMSPEQAKGRPADQRSDLFSLGATLYEAYTGDAYVPVDPGESLVEVQMRVASLGPFDRHIEGPDALAQWFKTALAPRPEDRFQSAEAMQRALHDALADTSA